MKITYVTAVACVATVMAVGYCVAAQRVAITAQDIRWGEPTQHARLDGDKLVVNVPHGESPSGILGISCVVPMRKIGHAQAIRATIRARGSGIERPAVKYHGLKFQFRVFDHMMGMARYPNTATVKHGTFPWRTLDVFAVLGGLESDGDVSLHLGLQGTSGEVEFDLSSLVLEPVENLFPKPEAACTASYSPDVADMPQLRGVMLPGGRDLTEDDFREMERWGVRLARYQMIRNWGATGTDQNLEEYDVWINGRLDHLETFVLPMARKYGMRIVVDVHVPPGGRNSSGEMNMFFDARFRDHFVALWRRIAARFRGNPDVIYGYDLINEPQQLRPAPYDYWSVQRDAATAVREIDPDTPIIVESNNMDSPQSYAYMMPLSISNVIYSVHMYVPSDYTHQGVHGGESMTWPDPGRNRDRDFLRRALANVRDFQKRHSARIYVGEFSAVAWAEGADRYIADCIAIFEEYGWDWTYHSFRGWSGWSVEHGGADVSHMTPSADNPRKRALLAGLESSSKPKGDEHENKPKGDEHEKTD